MEEINLPDNAPNPRLCHVTKWPEFQGYGFSLHGEKTKPGQFIGKIDPDSPAEAAGLKEGDKIIEVNGVNVSHENHKQVVTRIKGVVDETRLLVVDEETEKFYKENDIVITGSLSSILRLSSARTTEKNDNETEDLVDETEKMALSSTSSPVPPVVVEVDRRSMGSVASNASSIEKKAFGSSMTSGSSPRSTPSPEPRSVEPVVSQPDGVRNDKRDWAGLNNLNLTVAEMREVLGSKKKRDPRKDDRMDFRKKFEIIQKL